LYVPGVVNRCENGKPSARFTPESKRWSADVTEWPGQVTGLGGRNCGDSQLGMGSLADSSYVHVTVVPAWTVTLAGMNAKSFMLTRVAGGPACPSADGTA